MSTKAKILYTLLGTFFLILTALVLYFSLDSAPYDDKHLALQNTAIPDEENGYLKILKAIKLQVNYTDVISKQSEYISKLSDRRDIFNKCSDVNMKVVDVEKDFDNKFVNDLLQLNEKSFEKLQEALKMKEFYQNTQSGFFKENTVLIEILMMQKLILLKAQKYKYSKDVDSYCAQIKIALKFSMAIDKINNTLMAGFISFAIKSLVIRNIFVSVERGFVSGEKAFDEFGSFEKYGISKESLSECFRGEYQVFKNSLKEQNLKYLASDVPPFLARYLFKKNMTKKRYGEYLTSCIERIGQIYIRDERTRRTSGVIDYLNSNYAGNRLLLDFTPVIERFVQRLNSTKSQLRLLDSLIAIKRFETKTKKLPDTLERLVPEYLSKVPIDAQDGKPIKYSKKEKKVWMSYYIEKNPSTHDYT